ncbi:hypothetical protein XI00_04935 [Bradyrhizobium sp. CCBAU 21359]|uniref:hypothetical protein n=1 Tax=Bradyrhizobium sp. CCBAU 21359 TaxID=1325080 RepID=UPI002304F773|nr:hypothetical protein [Bradyrhizobium sp. CCBAU 21359]MDA9453639.1 hypothetical protein [Bradyrhizobium sp. CCBAU 21359]
MFTRYIHELAGLANATGMKTVAAYVWATCLELPTVISSRNLAAADKRIEGKVTFWTWGQPVAIDCKAIDADLQFDQSSCFGLAREIYGRNVYLRPFRKFTAQGKAAIDLGGNRGLVTAMLVAAIEPETILYVEPDERYVSTMRALTSPFKKTAVVAQHGFAGASPTNDAPLDIDSIAPRNAIAFVKMDIEGAEEALLSRAGPWLDRVERIAMESHPELCNVANVVRSLEDLGFTTLATDAIGRAVDPGTAMFVYGARNPENFV